MQPPMSQEEFEQEFTNAKNALESLPSAVDALMVAYRGYSITGSQAAEDEWFSELEAARAVPSLADLALAVCTSHMFALHRALTPPILVFAPWTLARGVLEAAAGVVWLLAPGKDFKRRIARSLTLRLQSIMNQRQFVDSSDGLRQRFREEIQRRTQTRIGEMVAQAKQLGIKVTWTIGTR